MAPSPLALALALAATVTTGVLVHALLPEARVNSKNWLARVLDRLRVAWGLGKHTRVLSCVSLLFLCASICSALVPDRDVLLPRAGALDVHDLTALLPSFFDGEAGWNGAGGVHGAPLLLHSAVDFAVNSPEDWIFWLAFLAATRVQSPLVAWVMALAAASQHFFGSLWSFGGAAPTSLLANARLAVMCAAVLRFTHLVVSWAWARRNRVARPLLRCDFGTGDVLTTSCVSELAAVVSQVITMSPWGHVAIVVKDPSEEVRTAFAVAHWLRKTVKAHKWKKKGKGGGGVNALLQLAMASPEGTDLLLGVLPPTTACVSLAGTKRRDALIDELFRAGDALGYSAAELEALHAHAQKLKPLGILYRDERDAQYGPAAYFDGPEWAGLGDTFVAEAVGSGVRLVPVTRWVWFWFVHRQERVAWRSLTTIAANANDDGAGHRQGQKCFLLEKVAVPYAGALTLLTAPVKDELERQGCCKRVARRLRPRRAKLQYICSSFAADLLRQCGGTVERHDRDVIGYVPRSFNESRSASGAIDAELAPGAQLTTSEDLKLE